MVSGSRLQGVSDGEKETFGADQDGRGRRRKIGSRTLFRTMNWRALLSASNRPEQRPSSSNTGLRVAVAPPSSAGCSPEALGALVAKSAFEIRISGSADQGECGSMPMLA